MSREVRKRNKEKENKKILNKMSRMEREEEYGRKRK